MDEADRVVSSLTRWFLAHGEGMRLAEAVARYAEGIEECLDRALSLGPPDWSEERRGVIDGMTAAGVSEDVARRHGLSAALLHGPDVVDVSEATGRPVSEVLQAFLHVGRAVYLDRLEEVARGLDPETPWQRWALQTVDDDLVTVRRRLVERMLARGPGLAPEEAVAGYLVSRAGAVGRLVRFMRAFDGAPLDDVAPLMVAVRQVRSLSA